MKKALSLLLVFGLAFSVLPGCASKYGEKKTVVNYYPGCYRPIQELRDHEHDVAKGTAGGAVVGALGGALVGLLASGGKWQGAVAGAATGAVTGAVAGNIYASKQKEMDDNKRLASYLQDLDGDISNLDVQAAAARTSLQCYDREFKVLVSQIKGKSITRQAAQQRYGEISSGREEAIAILGDVINSGRDLDRQYEQAFMQEEQNIQAPAKRAQSRSNNQALKQARNRKKALTQKTVAYEKERTDAQAQTVAYNKEFNEISGLLDATKS